jgi:hypothetical protein
MSNKPLNISESAAVQMPMKTVASLIVLVAMGVFAYTELTARLVSLETSRELFENDLLKKSEQVPTDQEQHFLIEDLYKTVEKMEETQEMNMTNKVNIEFLREQLDKALEDIEGLKDKVAKRESKSHIKYQCIKSKAELEENIDGSLSIKKLILE